MASISASPVLWGFGGPGYDLCVWLHTSPLLYCPGEQAAILRRLAEIRVPTMPGSTLRALQIDEIPTLCDVTPNLLWIPLEEPPGALLSRDRVCPTPAYSAVSAPTCLGTPTFPDRDWPSQLPFSPVYTHPSLVPPLEKAPLLLVSYPNADHVVQGAYEPLHSRKCLSINCHSLEEFGLPDLMSHPTRKAQPNSTLKRLTCSLAMKLTDAHSLEEKLWPT